jgi:secondary thiamine-phosphate synthase enzyme
VISLEVRTGAREEILDLSAEIAQAVRREGLLEGVCVVFVPHTTAGVTVNENADPDVKRDILLALERIVPEDQDFRHAEGNSTAHVKSLLCGSSVSVPVSGGSLVLGNWGGIYFCEFDGPRTRKLHLSFLPEDSKRCSEGRTE